VSIQLALRKAKQSNLELMTNAFNHKICLIQNPLVHNILLGNVKVLEIGGNILKDAPEGTLVNEHDSIMLQNYKLSKVLLEAIRHELGHFFDS
jgi:predicted Zn-dependent protease